MSQGKSATKSQWGELWKKVAPRNMAINIWLIFMMASGCGLTICLIVLGLHYFGPPSEAGGGGGGPSAAELNEVNEIVPGVFVTSMASARDAAAMKKLAVSHVLSVTGEYPPLPGINYKCLALPGSGDISGSFDECADFIDAAVKGGGRAVVHCQHGQSRSVAIAIAYCIKAKQMSLPNALGLVKKKRPVIEIRAEFVGQLQTYAKAQ